MGLDQYLYAERRFDPHSDQAATVLTAANTTLEQLQGLSKLDPREHETSIYLSRWSFEDSDAVAYAEAVERAADLLDFATEHSQGGSLGWHQDGYVYVTITAVYWRKSNQVHKWFVDNCQSGVDDCGDYEVHPEQLLQLRSACVDALEAVTSGDLGKVEEILPPQAGFFFGGTDIDEWYVRDLTSTVEDLDRVVQLAASKPGAVHWTYHSSW